MENFDDEYRNYWETNMFLQSEELGCYFDEGISGYYDSISSSPDGTQSSSSSSLISAKNIVSERIRRRKLNERLYALRSVVPNITKMDKSSIIRDAIKYIQSLIDEEKTIQAELSELESMSSSNSTTSDLDQETITFCSNSTRTKFEHCYDSAGSTLVPSPLEVLDLRVCNMGKKTTVITLTCSKRRDTILKLCEMFESLNLKITTTTITAFSGRILETIFLEGDEEENDVLKLKIEAAIAATLEDPDNSVST